MAMNAAGIVIQWASNAEAIAATAAPVVAIHKPKLAKNCENFSKIRKFVASPTGFIEIAFIRLYSFAYRQ